MARIRNQTIKTIQILREMRILSVIILLDMGQIENSAKVKSVSYLK